MISSRTIVFFARGRRILGVFLMVSWWKPSTSMVFGHAPLTVDNRRQIDCEIAVLKQKYCAEPRECDLELVSMSTLLALEMCIAHS